MTTMTKSGYRQLFSALLFAAALGSRPAFAVMIQVDLDPALSFYVNPNPNYSVQVNPASNIDVEFVDLDGSDGHGVGASQYLQVFDLTQQVGADPNPPQDINVFLNGNVPSGLAGLAFQLEFTGVSGTISATSLVGASPFCTSGAYCSSGATGADLIVAPPGQDASFLYHDFHISFSTDADGSISPFDITSLAFGGAADKVAIGAIPEPATLVLFGLGAVGIAYQRRKRPKA
jgi:hypothetical protein